MNPALRQRLQPDRVIRAVESMADKWHQIKDKPTRGGFDAGRAYGLAEAIAFLIGYPVSDVEANLKANKL